MGAWRWVVARASEFGEVSLAVILSVVAGLMFATACGAPDEVMRGQAQLTGGNTGGSSGGALSSSSSSGGTTTVAGSTASSTPTGGSVGPGGAGSSGSPGGTSSAGGTAASGGTTTVGGRGGSGGISNTGGKGSGGTGGKGSGGAATGGKNTGGAATGGIATGGTTASSTSSTGGTTFPFGGTTDAGGAGGVGSGGVATGGTTRVSSGGAGGSSGGESGSGGVTSTAPPPSGSLQVYVTTAITGATGSISLRLRIDNMTANTVDTSAVTLRYWYKDEGLGTTLMFAGDYVSIGYSNQGTMTGKAVAASPAAPGADHYLELSFTGTLAAKGDSSQKDQFNVRVTAHTGNYQGAVDVANDYSYNAGALGYNDKITLYAGGKLIWGTEP